VPLFCPKCGHHVSNDDNFCSSCGANIKNVHVEFRHNNLDNDSKEKTNRVNKISEETRVFNPKSLDGIDTTDDIKNIIAEVDKKVSKNIEDYKKENTKQKSNQDYDNFDLKKSNNKSNNKNTKKNHNIENDDFKISQSELIRRVQEELKKSNFDESNEIANFEEKKDLKDNSKDYTKDNEAEKINTDSSEIENNVSKKFSIKEKWKNFINEDDDEFSIFSNMKNDSKTDEVRNEEIADSINNDKSFENTLSTPKIKAYELDDSKDDNNIKKTKNDVKSKNNANKSSKSVENTSKDKKSIKDLFKINKKEESKEIKKDLNKDSIKDSNKNNISDKESRKEKLEDLSHKASEDFKQVYDFTEKITSKIANYIKEIGSKESKIVLATGISLTAISILIGNKGFSPILIIFLILKILFDYVQFYIPLNIATDKDDIDTSYEEVKFNSLITWIICKVVLFIGFLISPFGGFLKYNELSALTAMPLATLVLITIAPIISITLYRSHFRNRSKINFIGWYSIAFILFELLFKMIWFIINFVFVTLF